MSQRIKLPINIALVFALVLPFGTVFAQMTQNECRVLPVPQRPDECNTLYKMPAQCSINQTCPSTTNAPSAQPSPPAQPVTTSTGAPPAQSVTTGTGAPPVQPVNQQTNNSSSRLENPLAGSNITTVEGLLAVLLDILVIIATPIVVIFIILSGFKYVTAQGNETKLEEAKRALIYAIIGGVLIIGASAIAEIIAGTVDSFRNSP